MITRGIYTSPNSDLYWKVHQVYSQKPEYLKAKVTFFYKSSNNICQWLNPTLRPKTVKFKNTDLVGLWRAYEVK